MSQTFPPRRTPAHLSVSLRHEKSPATAQNAHRSGPSPPSREISGDSGESAVSGVANAKGWFNRSNKNPGGTAGQILTDNDPPYFLQRGDSSLSNAASDQDPAPLLYGRPIYASQNAFRSAMTNGSSAGDFRSVIDDLTIENQKLREKLRKYETSHAAHLEKDKLFEVKIHGLPTHKKRELEETLRSFALRIDGRKTTYTADRPAHIRHKYPSLVHSSRNASSASTSNSLPVDSAYASLSISEPKSSDRGGPPGERKGLPTSQSKEQNVESFLKDIPEGLLPRHNPVLTEKARKKIVVLRLEQLFVGKGGSSISEHSQPLQQQEISKLAARDDRQAFRLHGQMEPTEGIREANIQPMNSDDSYRCFETPTVDSSVSGANKADGKDAPASPEQRPTRPLDLDPDRAQVPSENIDYIRHLGLSSPNMEVENSEDATPDSDGWVYLNLLINMAQLHIFNVTPDFVRQAVSEVSEKFQLSRDGRKIRWRGGTEGTRLSSDSGEDSFRTSPVDGDRHEDSTRKRRKTQQAYVSIQDDSSPPTGSASHVNSHPTKNLRSFQYKPLFRHSRSDLEDGTSYNESVSYIPGDVSGTGHVYGSRPAWLGMSRSVSSRKRRDDGSLVFYNGAPFCIDLSGDRDGISTPSYAASFGKHGYSASNLSALGLRPMARHALTRTESGSALAFRPFKDYSKCAEVLQEPQSQPSTPDVVTQDAEDDLEFCPTWATVDKVESKIPLDLDACGLGGTVPADHFVVHVKTVRNKLDDSTRKRLSKFSTPNARRRRFLYSIKESSLEFFRPDNQETTAITSYSTSTRASPVRIEVLSSEQKYLEPSALPPPASYFVPFSSSDEYSDDSSSVHASEYGGHVQTTPLVTTGNSSSESCQVDTDVDMAKDKEKHQSAPRDVGHELDEDEYDDDDDVDDDDSDESIDMLAHARETDPKTVAAYEEEFEREVAVAQRIAEELPLGSSAATVGGWSAISSETDYISGSSSSSD